MGTFESAMYPGVAKARHYVITRTVREAFSSAWVNKEPLADGAALVTASDR